MNPFSPSPKILEIHETEQKGFQSLVTFQTWRVAMMTDLQGEPSEKLCRLQRHMKTDEVFILLQGKCILFLADGEDQIEHQFAEDLKLFRVYNVKQGVWHSHILSEDAKIIIVENADTSPNNSQYLQLSDSQRERFSFMAKELWGTLPYE